MPNVELPVYDRTGAEVAKFSIDTDAIATHVSAQLLHDAVVMYRANLRQGSAKTKSRAEVAGHKKKMYKQKGTGNARAGHRRSGVRRGGGHIFAKQPRDWSYRLPRKALRAATRMAMLSKIQDKEVVLLDSLSIDVPKTKEVATVLKNLGLNSSVLVALETHNTDLHKSFRNIAGVCVLPVSDLNAYQLLRPKRLLLTKHALELFVENAKQSKNKE